MKFYAEGHAGYAKRGEDVVCAAISALLQQAAIGLKSYLKIDISFEHKSGFLIIDLEKIDLQGLREKVDVLLESMYLTLKNIEKEYPRYFKLIEKN